MKAVAGIALLAIMALSTASAHPARANVKEVVRRDYLKYPDFPLGDMPETCDLRCDFGMSTAGDGDYCLGPCAPDFFKHCGPNGIRVVRSGCKGCLKNESKVNSVECH